MAVNQTEKDDTSLFPELREHSNQITAIKTEVGEITRFLSPDHPRFPA
ncbi:MAG: hypothetical protein WD266_11045 [Balneolales bacterium]